MSPSMFQIGPYEVLAGLGRDALGTTYLCREVQSSARFRVTHVSERLARDSQFCDALEQAREPLALGDPGLVTAELGTFGWGSYLASPYVESATLADLLAVGSPCSSPTLARILLDILDGLAAAHARGHLHLHLAPERILIGCDGVARISELGLAKARSLLEPGLTPYTAPRVAGEPADARSDVFAIGAIAWSALTGQALFAGHDERATRERLLGLPVPPPSEVGVRAPAAWDALVLRALARDPLERHGSARELRDALAAAIPELATHAEVGLWVESTFTEAFTRSRARVLEPVRDFDEVPSYALREVPPPRRARGPSTGSARAVAFLGASFALGILAAVMWP